MSDITIQSDAPPDWEARASELLCPLCKYNLRGLTSPRCPECGFAFSWNELIEAEKNKHKYLFEHAKGIGFKSFWKTYWRTAWPRRFWRDLNPARVGRMIVYWFLTLGIVFSACFGSRAKDIYALAQFNFACHGMPPLILNTPMTQAQLDQQYPLPWHVAFWQEYFGEYSGSFEPSDFGRNSGTWISLLAVWPFLTLAALLVFRMSMRQAKIRSVHLLRTTIYSCDAGLFLAASYIALAFLDLRLADGWLILLGAVACSFITTYRLTIAFRKYLRVHLPFATVIASQIIALLIVFLVLVQIADFSRRV